jgi:predicted ATPase/class 3 adenylate cyclase/Tfp pilus assembly protein PilF
MATDHTLLFTDIVDSTALNARLGDAGMAALWDAHDRASRELLRRYSGREIDRSDGFLMLFDGAGDAAAYAMAYHQLLAALPVPMRARAGIHVGPLTLRETPADDVALGAKPVEVLGLAKAIGARVMALAQPGQTLMSAAAHAALVFAAGGPAPWRSSSHGHWRLKGLGEVLELFELGDADTAFMPPPDSDKALRVVLADDGQWLSLRQVPHSLPAERDGFVGRGEELQALDQFFQAGVRLLTVTGPGGMGKTRLALRYAWAWMGDFPGGVWFCDLSAARELDGVAYAVAQGLGVPLGNDPLGQLGRAIAGRGRCLVILDNFEQVRRHARDTLGRWLDAAPAACFVVTSRAVLGLPGEQTLALAPLAAADGVALFHERARAAHAAHDATAHGDITRQLVELLDGMPLAIELAAPRVRVMQPPELLARMGDRFRLLSAGHGRPDRQATLRATLGWSWDLLTPAERAMLAQLSVFEGGFDWLAVQAVVAIDDDDDMPWVLDVLQSLVDKSLVTPMLGSRFGLLRSVQEFAAEQLRTSGRLAGSGPALAAAAAQRHCHHFARLDERAATAGNGVELDNIVRACRQAISDGDSDDALASLRLTWAILRMAGPFRVAAALADEVAAMAGLAPLQAAGAMQVAASARLAMGANQAAREAAEQAVALLDGQDAPWLRARCFNDLGAVALAAGDFESSAAHLDLALACAERAEDADSRSSALNARGALAQYQSRLDAARENYQAGLAIAFAADLPRRQGGLLCNLAGLHYAEGRLDAALDAFAQSLKLSRAINHRKLQGEVLCNLGLIHLEQGRLDEAEAHLSEALANARTLGYPRLANTVVCNLGLLAQRRGDFGRAVEHFAVAVGGTLKAGDTLLSAQYLAWLAAARAHAGDIALARADIAQGRELLAPSIDPTSAGMLACAACEIETLAGDHRAALAALQQARDHLHASGAGRNSELGRWADRAAGRLDALNPC